MAAGRLAGTEITLEPRPRCRLTYEALESAL